MLVWQGREGEGYWSGDGKQRGMECWSRLHLRRCWPSNDKLRSGDEPARQAQAGMGWHKSGNSQIKID